MRVLVFEDNLMWSSRLLQSLKALGHVAVLAKEAPVDGDNAEAAIVNLGSPKTADLIPKLKAQNIHIIGHAGHKEKELHQFGKEAGCDTLATNSELTFKLESILAAIG